MRVVALSDLHADHEANARWLEALSSHDHQDDALILAGDVSHDLEVLARVLTALLEKFARVIFVPGNHELWVRRDEALDSIAKFKSVLDLAVSLGVQVEPVRHAHGDAAVWIVPLFGWYTTPEQGRDTLYLPGPGPDVGLRGWLDLQFTRWSSLEGQTPAEYFLSLNEPRLARRYDAPVLSFSHFLPRRELMFRDGNAPHAARPPRNGFNFSRVAGSSGLERQLRRLGAAAHVYGHQHRNRRRALDGVLYLSHCLGYPRERLAGSIGDVGNGPAPVWPSGTRAGGDAV